MKKNNIIFSFLLLVSFFYIYLFFKLASYLEFWIIDLQNCYKVMKLNWFLIEHINIFFYIFLFLVMGFYITKAVFTFIFSLKKLLEIKRNIFLLKIKQFKNIIVIDYPSIVAFNFLNKIVLSNKIFKKLNKKERKTIFLHEKGHLNSLDSFKLFFTDILLTLFPNFLKEKIFRIFVLASEENADKFATKIVGKKVLADTLLNVVSLNSSYPLMNNFTQERLKLLLEDKDVKVPKYIWFIYIFFISILLLLVYYKTCLCGAM
ncbi:MAG TPA: hypothetical protein EYH43_05690 [Persephonella sp.]|nr:hypothetical protein [Hydrogenothermaceae bacterium]HIQ25457.1 hypothetical protein [Persephonella sp.]